MMMMIDIDDGREDDSTDSGLMENFQDETYPTTAIQLALYRYGNFHKLQNRSIFVMLQFGNDNCTSETPFF